MAAQRQEDKSATISDATWVTILAALVAALGALVVLVPETELEIVVATVTFVALVSILVYKIETYLSSKGHPTVFRGRPGLSLVFAAIALGGISGTLIELASSAAEPPVRLAIPVYEKQIRQVLNPLREESANAFKTPGSLDDPDRYSKSASELSEAYRLASKVLGDIEPPRRGDQVVHSRLGFQLASVGEAYARLGKLVANGAGKSSIATAEGETQKAIEGLLESEEELRRHGYRVALGS